MLSSPLQTSSSATMIDDRFLRAYLRQNSTGNLDESGHMDHYGLTSSGNGEKFLNSSVHFPTEMRSANLNEMVSSIIDENNEYQRQQHGMISTCMPQQQTSWMNHEQTEQQMHYIQQMKRLPLRQTRSTLSSTLSESGCPRNIPDNCSIQHHPPKDVQVLIHKSDHNGMNPLIKNIPLQQFRQIIGLQRSSGSSTFHERRNRHNNHNQQSLSSSSSSSSLPTTNIRLINGFNQQWSQDINSNQQQNHSRQHLSMIPISSHDTMTMNDPNQASPITSCQEMSYYRSNRRTGVANTLHIAIEKCYEQLNYIRDSYAETESKIGIQILHKSTLSVADINNTNFANLSNNPSRVDRLIAEYHYEYNRIIRLHERIQEGISIQDIEATGQTLDEWLNAINTVQDRRRQEIENATEKCRTGEPRLPDEKDVLQLAESLRILRITTRKIRTVLWYWLYWSTNSVNNKIPLITRQQDQTNRLWYSTYDILKSDDQQLIVSNDNNKENQYSE
ncbi:hypothetical protein I4U23_028655 [Adineta vaga]|nr:hypothetical protein I4U23_028655 [Adineta vaga]